ncbi:MAG: biopolymer transporter ExbD [Deltaproteobacteria bacterium]|nr:biopolymer transporter ExbD [Deltaproteobacteria bacterium]
MSLSIEAGKGAKGHKAVDSEVSMVPFIDLLVCCISFLIITAVWTQLERLNLTQEGGVDPIGAPEPDQARLSLQINDAGFAIADGAGSRIAVPKVANGYDLARLGRELEALRKTVTRARLVVMPEDGVRYEAIVAAMDVALAARFDDLSLSSAAM